MSKPCVIDGCIRPLASRGMCSMHLTRQRRHGSPHIVKKRPYPKGADHHMWRGDDATYHTAHARTQHARGKASAHPCVDCGSPAQQWSYTYTAGPRELTDPRGYAYSPNPDDYDPRCVPCHSRFDIDHRPPIAAGPDETECVTEGCVRAAQMNKRCRTHYADMRKRGEVGRVSADKARAYLDDLIGMGWPVRAISRETGIARRQLLDLLERRWPRVLMATEARLLALPLTHYERRAS